jgi:hypothetical protein
MASDLTASLARLLLFTLGCASCAHHDVRRFALAPPLTRDQDLDPVTLDCRDAAREGKLCAPEPYESSLSWDAADNTVFRPISKFFEVDSHGEAENVNAFDEVPDSSWFNNRIGARAMSAVEVARGYCPEGPELSSDPPDGSWLIDRGKSDGANPGFRVSALGTKFMFKTDDSQPERATAATAIAARLYYAAGYWAPCDSVVYFKLSALRLTPGLSTKTSIGRSRPLDQRRLLEILSRTARRGVLYRATASRWLPGVAIGPFKYEGTRSDDPSDTIPHENRRDLRGARLMAAWLNHFDSREQNTMSTWLPERPKDPQSRGHVRHWYIDLGDSFGSEWTVDGISKRHGHAYLLDFSYLLEDFATLGSVERPWDRAGRTPGLEIFGYFSARDFDPELWRGEYPNPAFGRMTERDGAWAARIISRFTPEHVEAAVRVGDFTSAAATTFLTRVLLERRQRLLQRYFSKLSPVSDVRIEPQQLCAVDLARQAGVFDAARFRYRASVSRGGGPSVNAPVSVGTAGNICLTVASASPRASLPANAQQRYVLIELSNGVTSGPLLLHLYDLGPARGLELVGIERPG